MIVIVSHIMYYYKVKGRSRIGMLYQFILTIIIKFYKSPLFYIIILQILEFVK